MLKLFVKGIKLCITASTVIVLNIFDYFYHLDLWYYYSFLIEVNGPVFIKIFQHIGQYNNHVSFLKNSEHYLKKMKETVNFHSINYTNTIINKYNLNLSILPNFCKSGSLGQVYKCIYDNKICSLKILHPNIEDDINSNFFYIKKALVCCIKNLQIDFDGLHQSIIVQSDFINEYKNYKIFSNNFKDYQNIVFPKIHYFNKELLISDFINFPDQEKLDFETKRTGSILFTISIYKMVFIDNFVHGDLHSGNWKIIPNQENNKTKIVFFDTAIYFKSENLKYLQKTLYYEIIRDRPKLLSYILKFLGKEEFEDEIKNGFVNTKDPWKYVFDSILQIKPDTKLKQEYVYIINTMNYNRKNMIKHKVNMYHVLRRIKHYQYKEILNIFEMADIEFFDDYIVFNETKRRIKIYDKKKPFSIKIEKYQ